MTLIQHTRIFARRARQWGQIHHRRILAIVGGGLMLTSVAAFALDAVGPQPNLLIPAWVSIPVANTAPEQDDALTLASPPLDTLATVRAQDSVDSLLRRLKVTDPRDLRVLSANLDLQALVSSDPGRSVSARVDDLGRLQTLRGRLPGMDRVGDALRWWELRLRAVPTGFDIRIQTHRTQPSLQAVSGVIKSDFFSTADAAGLPNAVFSQLTRVFSPEVDFRHGMRKGDPFHVVYQIYQAHGQTLQTGRLMSAALTHEGRRYRAVWFNDPSDTADSGYYTPEGQSLSHSFLPSPLPYERITSGWGWRENPVMHFLEFHKGIDFAIPSGTPVKTIAAGRVVYAGWGTGYGQYVKIDHPGGFASLYAHLSAFKVHVGEFVRQGEVVALSGSTGWSTGPHVYFQFFVHGTPVDPLHLAQYAPKETAVPFALKPKFLAQTAPALHVLALMEGWSDVQTASANATGRNQPA